MLITDYVAHFTDRRGVVRSRTPVLEYNRRLLDVVVVVTASIAIVYYVIKKHWTISDSSDVRIGASS